MMLLHSIIRTQACRLGQRYFLIARRKWPIAGSVSFTTSTAPHDHQTIRIGHVERPIHKSPSLPHLTPRPAFIDIHSSPDLLLHLQWMMQKDELAQDMLLIGPPGSPSAMRRDLALEYARLFNREVQVLSITSDLTESDLKQRRELVLSESDSHTDTEPSITNKPQLELQFANAAPVDAAIHGRILILDGLERASRNVLPTLNNLLEHRSMNLEDGRFLLSRERYNQLVDPPDSLVPVHADFRVISTCVPAPTWPGRPLDPPLRSRFQIRRVETQLETIYSHLHATNTSTRQHATPLQQDQELLAKLTMAMESASQASAAGGNIAKLWPIPLHHLAAIQQTLETFPRLNRKSVVLRAYPVGLSDPRMTWFHSHDGNRKAFDMAWEQVFGSTSPADPTKNPYELESVRRVSDHQAVVTFSIAKSNGSWYDSDPGNETVELTVPCGSLALEDTPDDYCLTEGLNEVVQAILTSHAFGKDILLVSPPGESKSATTAYVSSLLGYRQRLLHIFPEMSLSDLFLRRATDPISGQTTWEPSSLLDAIRHGELCVLDGVEKLRPDILAALQSFCLNRDVFLPDGRRILPADASLDTNDAKVIHAHPSFRLMALASTAKEAGAWLTQDAMSMFATVVIPPLGPECARAILKATNPTCHEDTIEKLVKLRAMLTAEVAVDCGVSQVSTRNMIRIVRRVGTTTLGEAVRQVLVTDLLPPTQRIALDSVLKGAGIKTRKPRAHECEPERIVCSESSVTIGDFSMVRTPVERPEMVPAPRFFDIPNHVRLMKDLLSDWSSGERAFLILGNQGVGKNVVIDRLCEIANFEREYVQLHRDSTIGQLTLQPSLQNGLIIWKDSPLVRAAVQGSMLVIDEADKAPTEVLAVLKGLAEDGELLLGDGRRISQHEKGPGIIEMHRDFTLVVLANRPGFPFQGNQFFKQIGDCFSTRVVSNPDIDSEIKLLTQYGPDVNETLVRSIAGSFAELRSLADRADIIYPYSTREAVAFIKHKQQYPSDDIVSILHNVLDFDSYDSVTYAKLGEVFQRHGIDVERYASWQQAMLRSASTLKLELTGVRPADGTSSNPPPLNMPKVGKWDDKNEAHVGGNQWAGGTGGSNTAGLGGRGGPYRLDRGHHVHQVSDEKKAEVSEEARKAARVMAEKALKEKLQEIDMSETEWDMYLRFLAPIQTEIATLRAILNQVDMKQSEKTWLRRQSHGEVDDSRLVEGVTGDRSIYKRRGSSEDAGPIVGPKKLSFIVDVSGSMYRFNGYDERLYRCLESVNLVMESFYGMQQRFDYEIVGHSGDSPRIPFVSFGSPPTTEKLRMRVLQGMIAHSQYCQSGDHTLEAVEQAIANLSALQDECESGGGIVIAVSDANLRRYGIHPRYLAKAIDNGNEHKVKAHCIFIGSLGEEAEEIRRELPVGRGYVCMQTKELPSIIRSILSTNI